MILLHSKVGWTSTPKGGLLVGSFNVRNTIKMLLKVHEHTIGAVCARKSLHLGVSKAMLNYDSQESRSAIFLSSTDDAQPEGLFPLPSIHINATVHQRSRTPESLTAPPAKPTTQATYRHWHAHPQECFVQCWCFGKSWGGYECV